MIHINKDKSYEFGRHINSLFLRDCFNPDEASFIPEVDLESSFDSYRANNYRKQWLPLLLQEQNGVCCYCMRTLGPGARINIEHIVPKVTDEDMFARYVSASAVIKRHVMHASDYKLRVKKIEDIELYAEMPHMIAHTNLLATCNGTRNSLRKWCCCNNLRGNDYIRPMMLNPGEEHLVRYDENGIMYIHPAEDSWSGILKELNTETYQEIRTVWRHIAVNTGIDIRDFNSETTSELPFRINLFKSAFKVDNFLDIDEQYRRYAGELKPNGNMFYWDLLVAYKWFLEYYRQ